MGITKRVKFLESYGLKDKMKTSNISSSIFNKNVLGKVEIYGIEKNYPGKFLLNDGDNTVVKQGRNVLFQKATDIPYTVVDINGSSVTDCRDTNLNAFMIGSGGASASSISTPIPPSDNDYTLSNPITISGDYLKDICSKSFESDNNGSEAIITLHCVFTIDFDEANNSSGEIQYINEAGLVFTQGNTYVGSSKNILLSRYTFPSIPKTADLALEFHWYLYF